MSKQMWMGACLAVVVAGASVAAQTSGSTSQRDQKASGDVTITGCLQRGGEQAGATGTSGTSSTYPSGTSTRSGSTSGQFILANATMGSSSRSGSTTTGGGTTTSGTTGSATSGTAGTSGNSFVLEGQDSELTKHVGHKVEITGTLDTSRDTSRSTSGSTSTGTTPPSSTSGSRTGESSANAQHVRVKSVKMISANCSAE